MTKFTVREVEYETVSTEESAIPSLQFLWLFVELVDNDIYKKADSEKIPMRVILEELIKKAQENINLYFGDLLSSLCRKGQAEEMGRLFRVFAPALPPENDPLFLTEACFAYITALAQEGVDSSSLAQAPTEEAPQPKKKAGKKKGGFGDKPEPEVPTLEAIAGREVTPEEIAAARVEGKPLEEAIAAPLIPISDAELAKLRPDLMTIEEQDLQAALAEQMANRLTVVSTPAPLDSDELEDLI